MNTIRGVNCEGLPSRRKRHARESSFPAPSAEPRLGPSSSSSSYSSPLLMKFSVDYAIA